MIVTGHHSNLNALCSSFSHVHLHVWGPWQPTTIGVPARCGTCCFEHDTILNTTRVVRVWGPKVKVNCFETIEVIWTDLRWFEESNFPTNQKDSCFLAWCRWFTFRKWWFPIATCWGSTRRSVPLWHRHPLSAWPMPGTWGELPGKHTWDIVYCRGATLRDYISHTLVDVWWWTYETKLMNQWTAQWIYSMSPSTPKNTTTWILSLLGFSRSKFKAQTADSVHV